MIEESRKKRSSRKKKKKNKANLQRVTNPVRNQLSKN